ncbi:alpha/beta fold hydrolase [Corynebacterium sp. UBA2622]|uniref:alpha/beta fold hydrolase n=1 Tax=Corynebacterium sp. UBA2622 TaxID=1946393 RepID=UPI0025C0639D|nr:alpha/beta hydrolase [Corynebacterium sp. UBA2622]
MTLITVTTDTGALNLNVEEKGEGRPVVLIHGWPLNAQSWKAQVEALTPSYRVITYDRRGFGSSEKPADGYNYDTLASDLHGLLEARDLRDVTLVGFSMGGGEVARYMSRYGSDRIHSVVFAAAVPPYLAKMPDNPEGPLDQKTAVKMREGLEKDREKFFESFSREFFSTPKLAGLASSLKVSEEQRQEAVAQALESDQKAALQCLDAFGTTDFRSDLGAVTVPALVIHGDGDQTVPFEGSGKRTHEAIEGSRLEVIKDAPHGLAVSHAGEFNRILLDFLEN